MEENRIRLVVGIGNPGEEYANTRHNAGILAVEYADELLGRPKLKKEKLFAYVKSGDFVVAKSLTFMNESGQAVRAALTRFKVRTNELLLVHDDSDLPLGEAQFVFGRGAAGHHGVESVIDALGTKDFWRLRLGIRTKKGKAGRFVLAPMSKDVDRSLQRVFSGTIEKVIEKESLPPSKRFMPVKGSVTP